MHVLNCQKGINNAIVLKRMVSQPFCFPPGVSHAFVLKKEFRQIPRAPIWR